MGRHVKEANLNSYLADCLVIAHALEPSFHKTMKLIVNLARMRELHATYIECDVLSREECVIRCSKIYYFELFPNAASILNFVSGKVVFENSTQMLEGINIFVEFIQNNWNDENTTIIEIVECTNTVSKHYNNSRGISFNVVICDKKTQQAIIGEVSFTLKWMLEAKQVCRCLFVALFLIVY